MMSGVTVWAPDRADPESVARKALTYDKLPDPANGTSPPAGQGAVVNNPVWLWVQTDAWAPTAATATIDGLTAVTTATPERVTWRLSTGDEVTCEGPGVPYDPSRPEAEQHSDCTHASPGAHDLVSATSSTSPPSSGSASPAADPRRGVDPPALALNHARAVGKASWSWPAVPALSAAVVLKERGERTVATAAAARTAAAVLMAIAQPCMKASWTAATAVRPAGPRLPAV